MSMQWFQNLVEEVIADVVTPATPGGPDTSIQFNNAGAFDGAASWVIASDQMQGTTAVDGGTPLLLSGNSGFSHASFQFFNSGEVKLNIGSGSGSYVLDLDGSGDTILTASGLIELASAGAGVNVGAAGNKVGFFGLATPVVKQTVTGAKVDPVAASILAALVAYGMVIDSTT